MKIPVLRVRVLLYHDGPVLFIAQDEVGTKYLCVLIEREADHERYLSIPISPLRLNSVITGDIDLRVVFESPEVLAYYLLNVYDYAPEDLNLSLTTKEEVDDSWFPTPGTFLPQIPQETENICVLKESIIKRTSVITLSLNPPEAISEHVISTPTLIRGLQIFQGIIRVSFKKAIKSLERETRRLLDIPDNYTTEVFGFFPASFDIYLKAKPYADLIGSTDIERGLELVDRIFEVASDPEKSLEILKENKGHVVNYYTKLLEFVIENNSMVSYSWASPGLKKVRTHSIYKSRAISIYEKISQVKELSTEMLELMGEFTKIDIKNNNWTIMEDETGKTISGGVKEGSQTTLRGATAGIQKYRFEIEEVIQETEAIGKEKFVYYLATYNKVPDGPHRRHIRLED